MVAYAFTIAGSEATGAAGFQTDLKTFHELGVFGMGALTCIVSIDPKNEWFHRFSPIAPDVIHDQIESALAARDIDTVKIGMLGTPETIETVSKALKSQTWRNIVLDPVLICKGGEMGTARDVDVALAEKILPQATVVTPNLFEARTLAGMEKLEKVSDLAEAGRRISEKGPRYVLVKGGVDLEGPEAIDVLWDGENATIYAEPKIGQERVSGAGCTLAAAITAELAKGTEIHEAVHTAKRLVTASIEGRVTANTPFDCVWQGAYSERKK
ncbi:MAG: bifunctional hydroxymethylpyrimidine kinase/phosphomethylpyrimidine kinase [Actinomycetaceae bacterium]|nr:bifunctional hydroxymethylpyrimidine kinase/phosphomethylpyrimidine kinase [Actinomycetaceae bacterium]